MRRPIKTRKDLDISSDHFLRRNPGYPIGVTLTELDYLRGHKCDFLGEQIPDEYDVTDFVGVGSSIALRDAAHGGHVILSAGPAVARYASLWLGDVGLNYDTLEANSGWVQIGAVWLVQTTTVLYYVLGAMGAASHRIIVRYDTNTGPNWLLEAVDGGGTTTVNSGVAADTNFHWHTLEVYPIAGGREAKHYLDGAHINTINANMPTTALTPRIMTYNRGTVGRTGIWDYWATIPRNL